MANSDQLVVVLHVWIIDWISLLRHSPFPVRVPFVHLFLLGPPVGRHVTNWNLCRHGVGREPVLDFLIWQKPLGTVCVELAGGTEPGSNYRTDGRRSCF